MTAAPPPHPRRVAAAAPPHPGHTPATERRPPAVSDCLKSPAAYAATSFMHWIAPSEKYVTDCELQFTLPDVLKVPPISQHGNVVEIIGKFGGADQLRNAVNQLQRLLYAA
jgi:hypothetical protein